MLLLRYGVGGTDGGGCVAHGFIGGGHWRVGAVDGRGGAVVGGLVAVAGG
jgi:hypothetical protein